MANCELTGSISAPLIEAAVIESLRSIVDDEGVRRAVFEQSEQLLQQHQQRHELHLRQLTSQRSRDDAELKCTATEGETSHLNDVRRHDLKARLAKTQTRIVEVEKDLEHLATIGNVSQPRITPILSLKMLAPDIQETLLFLPRLSKGKLEMKNKFVVPNYAQDLAKAFSSYAESNQFNSTLIVRKPHLIFLKWLLWFALKLSGAGSVVKFYARAPRMPGSLHRYR